MPFRHAGAQLLEQSWYITTSHGAFLAVTLFCLGPLSACSDSKYKSCANQLLEFSADLILCYLVTSPGNCRCWQVFYELSLVTRSIRSS